MTILQMSIYGSLLIIFTVIIRSVAINKLPKKVFIMLWLIAISRLLIPYNMPQIINVYPVVSTLNEVSGDRFITAQPQNELTQLNEPDISEINTRINENKIVNQITSVAEKINISIYTIIWFAGIFAFGIIFIIPHIVHSRKYKTSLPIKDDYIDSWIALHKLFRKYKVMVSDEIISPFTYGLFRPVILMSENIDINNRELTDYILTHEYIHIKRFDIVLKWLSAFTLCVNWFNPLVWLMYILMNRDIELSCDEGVVRLKGETNKKSYAMTLLDMEAKKINFNPLVNHFNKNSLKERVTAIMKIRKITILSTVLAFTLIISATMILITSCTEKSETPPETTEEATSIKIEENLNDSAVDKTEEIPEYITIQGERFSTSLTELDLSERQLNNYDIEPLRYMVNLTSLLLWDNQISDVSALAGLTNLTILSLFDNSISDISPLAKLTNLTDFGLGKNHISDITVLAKLTNLTGIVLDNNQISDVSALTGLTNLRILGLSNNRISDISALSRLINLTELHLAGNQIKDITAVTGLTNLTILRFEENQISDISAVAGLLNLTILMLPDNQIIDISALSKLSNLTWLVVWNNEISNISALSELTNLESLGLNGNPISEEQIAELSEALPNTKIS